MILWIDLETTGLDPEKDSILEFGYVVTDLQLEVRAKASFVVLQPPDVINKCNDFVKDMHTKNGLLDAVPSGVTFDFISEHMKVVFENHGLKKPLCGGRSVHFDRNFLKASPLAFLNDLMHYRNVDVSALYAVFEAWTGKTPPRKEGSHRVYSDLDVTLEEARWYREAMKPLADSNWIRV